MGSYGGADPAGAALTEDQISGAGDTRYLRNGATLSKSAAYTVFAADNGAFLKCSGSFTLSFDAAASLGSRFVVRVRNTGAGVVTLSAGSIDGRATMKMYPGESFFVVGDGAVLTTIGRSFGYIPIKDQSFSGVGAVAFDGVFTDEFDDYLISLKDIQCTANNSLAFVWRRAGVGITGTYQYGMGYANGSGVGPGGNSASDAAIIFGPAVVAGGANIVHSDLKIFSPAINIGVYKQVLFDTVNNNPNVARYYGGGTYMTDAQLNDGFYIFPNAGAFSGRCQLFGLRSR